MINPEPENQTPQRPTTSRNLPAIRMAMLLIAGVLTGGCATPRQAPERSPIAVQAVHLSGAGHYVDLRYRVLDAKAAQAALGPKVRPRLIDEATGRVMAVPTTAKLGSLRQTQAEQKTGRTYFVLFVNGGVREGSRVTAELGELRFEHLVIE